MLQKSLAPECTTGSVVHFRDLQVTFPNGTRALAGVDLDVPAGQFCVILGSSGAGKSTLLRTVNGLATPTAGEVEVDGVCVDKKTLAEVRPRVGMIHQQFHLVPRLSVLHNVLSGALPNVPLTRALLRWFPVDLQRRACNLLAEVGLEEEHLYRRASQLSGGQQQRVAIARAFVLGPSLVLADEPVASLDPATSESILALLHEASRRHGTTVLCSLHQVEYARAFADRVVGVRDGRIVFDGSPAGLDATALQTIYGAPATTARELPEAA